MLPARFRVALIALVAAGACTSAPTPAPAPTVTWRTCPDSPTPPFQCGSIRVAEQRGQAGGRQIEIAFVVSRASAPGAPAAEPLFALAGGPGDGSTSLQTAVVRWPAVLAKRDVVLVDQRGTGRSAPLDCHMNAAEHPASVFGHIFDRDLFRRCRVTLAATQDLDAYTTADAADDLDDVRAALGYEKILVWGGSYGTRLAQSYLQRHGDRVALAVLDSVAPLGVSLTGRFPVHVQESIDRIPEITAPLGRIVARLGSAPAHTFVIDEAGRRVDVTMTLGDFAYAIRGILYGARGSIELAELVRNADESRDLSGFAQRRWSRAVRMDRALAHGLHLSVQCGEDVPFITSEDEAAADKSIGGRFILDEYREACRIWNVKPVRPPAPEPRDVPALLLSGRFDPATPASAADRVLRWLPRGQHLVAPNAGHGVTFGCGLTAVGDVLRDGVIPSPLPPMCGAGR